MTTPSISLSHDSCDQHFDAWVVRLTEFTFRFEIELHTVPPHYYLWALETSLPTPRAEVRSLKLAVSTEFSSGKGREAINSNPGKI